MKLKSPKTLLIAILVIAFFGSLYGHKFRAVSRNYSDFHCFYTTGKRALNHENLYIIHDKETAEFRYAPIYAVFMGGLALLKEGDADTLWFILNYLLLIGAFIYLRKIIAPNGMTPKAAFWFYLLTVLSLIRIIFHNFNSGQSNILMLASIIFGLYHISKKRILLGSLIFALSIMIKYTPLVFIPYFLFRRKFKTAFFITAAVAFYLFLPSLIVGFETNSMYLKNLLPFFTQSTILEQDTILTGKNQSLLSMVYRSFTDCLVLYPDAPKMLLQNLGLTDAYKKLLFMVMAGLLYLAAIYKPRRKHLHQDNLMYNNIDYSILLVCVVLFNLNAWAHNFILFALPYGALIFYLIKTGFQDKFVLFAWVVSFVVNGFMTRSILGNNLSYTIYFYSPYTIAALLLFAALLKLKFSKNIIEEAKNES